MSGVAEVKDLASITDTILAQAIDYCAQKARLETSQTVIEHLRDGDVQVCEYCSYSLAKQVAASLGALDDNVQAAYLYDYDAPTDGLGYPEMGRMLPIHLILWATRKTAALSVVVETWDRVLTQRYAELIGRHQLAHLLDVQVVDSVDVVKRIGYGAMLSSLHHPPTEVWKR
jgi:hypothetical protein